MTELVLSIVQPFTSPAWGSNFVVFTGESGNAVEEELVKGYLNKACKYAKQHGVYLVPERLMLMGYHCMCLVSPLGEVLGAQKACYLNLARRVGKRSSSLEVFETEFGGIFLCVDTDVYHPEVCRFAAGLGAKVIICSQRIAEEEYGSHMVVSGCWNAAQLAEACVVAACNRFNCVCAPRAATPNGDGFLHVPGVKLPVTAKFSVDKLSYLPARPVISRRFFEAHRGELQR